MYAKRLIVGSSLVLGVVACSSGSPSTPSDAVLPSSDEGAPVAPSRNALVYFDDYGPWNGATRIVPGSHCPAQGDPPFDFADESRSVQLSGSAGDVLVFDADLVHAGSLNPTGARRRSILICYFAEPLYAAHLRTAKMRGIRRDTAEWFDPAERLSHSDRSSRLRDDL